KKTGPRPRERRRSPAADTVASAAPPPTDRGRAAPARPQRSDMTDPRAHGMGTRSVHAGERRDGQGAVHTPLYGSSTFAFASTAELLDVLEGRTEGNLYTRYGSNPTIRALEARLADLEDGERALAFSSGMAAASATFLAHAGPGGRIVCVGEVYGGTFELLNENLPRLGVTTAFVRGEEVERLGEALDERTRIVFLE